MLCTVCASLSISRLVEAAELDFSAWNFPHNAFYKHHLSYRELIKSALHGCELCVLIYHGFKNSITQDFPWEGQKWEVAVHELEKTGKNTDIKLAIDSESCYSCGGLDEVELFDTIMVQVGPPERIEEEDYGLDGFWAVPPLRLGLGVPRDHSRSIGGHRVGRQKLDPNLGSDANHGIARNWLEGCSHHEMCTSKSITELPTRVIDVGSSDGTIPPRLFLTEGNQDYYVALSHCWGGIITPLLKTENLEDFQKGISFSHLPANFQDAITITRKLRLRYVWIDSLCIIQNSKEDWEIESKKMGAIYRHSYVTISAAVARSSTVGILKTAWKSTKNKPPSPVEIPMGGSSSEEIEISLRTGDEESLRDVSMNSALNTRGWTLQETILSPRILHYGLHQIHYQCPSGFQSADGVPQGNRMPEDQKYPAISQFLYSYESSTKHPMSVDRALMSVDYYELVQEYSSRNLTFDSDKLPAFAGLAELIHDAMGGEYLAGIWSKDIRQGLLWYNGRDQARHISSYTAPSWSWAVTNDEILFYTMERKEEPGEYDVNILDYGVTCCLNPYGHVTDGFLILSGFTRKLVRSEQVINAKFPMDDVGDVRFDEAEHSGGKWKGLAALLEMKDEEEDCLFAVINGEGDDKMWDRVVERAYFSQREYLVMVVQVDSGKGEEGDEDIEMASCLVLRKLSDQEGKWERVGLVLLKWLAMETFEQWIETWVRKTVVVV